MAASKFSRAEQETILRWDEEDQTVDIYTVSERMAVKLQRRGYPLQPLPNPDHGWRARGIPLSALTFRRLGPDCSGRPKRVVKTAFQSRPLADSRIADTDAHVSDHADPDR
jgi:hypothetical protein